MKNKLTWHGIYCSVKEDRGRTAYLTKFGRGLYVISLNHTFKGSLDKARKEAERLLKCSLEEDE